MIIKQAIDDAKEKIEYINAKILMKHVLNVDNNYLILNSENELEEEKQNIYLELVEKVYKGFPVQYITNNQEFMKLKFYVDKNVLIPQQDTEILVQNAIEYLQRNKSCKVLDLCTGSGAIAISIKKYVKDAEVVGTDISKKALEIAEKNAKENKVDVKFIHSNMFENITGKFDLIVSNPPYIKTNVINKLPPDVQKEPHLALDGGIDGLKYYEIIYEDIEKYLNPNGTLMLEIGYDQKNEVLEIFKNGTCLKDYCGKDRVIIWNRFQEK